MPRRPCTLALPIVVAPRVAGSVDVIALRCGGVAVAMADAATEPVAVAAPDGTGEAHGDVRQGRANAIHGRAPLVTPGQPARRRRPCRRSAGPCWSCFTWSPVRRREPAGARPTRTSSSSAGVPPPSRTPDRLPQFQLWLIQRRAQARADQVPGVPPAGRGAARPLVPARCARGRPTMLCSTPPRRRRSPAPDYAGAALRLADYRPLVNASRHKLAEYLHVNPADLVLVENLTSAINAVFRSFTYQKGCGWRPGALPRLSLCSLQRIAVVRWRPGPPATRCSCSATSFW